MPVSGPQGPQLQKVLERLTGQHTVPNVFIGKKCGNIIWRFEVLQDHDSCKLLLRNHLLIRYLLRSMIK